MISPGRRDQPVWGCSKGCRSRPSLQGEEGKERALLAGEASVTRILVAVDGSEHGERAARYVGSLLRDARNVEITLFHVLKPMPRELLEHGGSENPVVEEQLSQQLRKEQEEWIRSESEVEYPILLKALEALGKTGFPIDRVSLRFGHERDVAQNILETARVGGYATVVVSRHGSSGLKRIFGGSVTDHLLREASGLTLWIVG